MRYPIRIMLWLLLMLPTLASPQTSQRALVFGIVPQESSSRLAEQWTPLMRALSASLGREVRFATAPDIPTFEQRVLEGHYDIAYMNPYHYMEFSQVPGYRAIAREGGKRIRGIVTVAADSPVQQLEELDGEILAFPAPAAFAATILVRAELQRRGINYTPRFVSSHESVYLNVQRGFTVAGGGIERTYESALRDGLADVRILWRTDGYTPHAFAVHPDLDPSVAGEIQTFLTGTVQHEQRALLERINLGPLVPASDTDWDDVRQLNLDFIKTTKGS